MRSSSAADFILKALENLHPKFYPHPDAIVSAAPGTVSFVPITDYLTKEELLKLYWKCGELLHRGDFTTMKQLREMDFDAVRTTVVKIINLLKFHRISLFGSADELWVMMEDPKTGKVGATLTRPA